MEGCPIGCKEGWDVGFPAAGKLIEATDEKMVAMKVEMLLADKLVDGMVENWVPPSDGMMDREVG